MPIPVTDQVTCSVTVEAAELPLVCGDGIVNLAGGETCDDGNTEDGDGCPSTCRIEPCSGPSQGRVTVQATLTGTPSTLAVAGATLLLDYPEGRVTLPGSNDETPVQMRVSSPAGFGVTPNDLDYALRAVLLDPQLAGISGGTARVRRFRHLRRPRPYRLRATSTAVCSTRPRSTIRAHRSTSPARSVVPSRSCRLCCRGVATESSTSLGVKPVTTANTEDGDDCPSTCRVEPCASPPQGRVTVQARAAGMPSGLTLAGMTLLLDYPEGRGDPARVERRATVQSRVSSPAGFGVTPNDLDYALRAVLLDPSLSGIAGGTTLSVDFDICAGEAVPVARNFRCTVVDATAVDAQGMLVDATNQVTCSIVVRPPVLPAVCGDGIVNLAGGETCDDGNTLDGDGCQANCRVEPCAAARQSDDDGVGAVLDYPTHLLSGMTLLVDYPEGVVGIEGSNNDAAVQSRVASPSFSLTPNDLDYALRAVLIDPSFAGVSAGTALTVQFDVCQGAQLPMASAFACTVLDAADVGLASVTDDVTCSVMLP
jgi:cysteine-rich repeat protein